VSPESKSEDVNAEHVTHVQRGSGPFADLEVPVPDRSDVPDFTVSLRGYDRQQVDEYVHRLTLDLDEAHARALGAEQRLAERASRSSGSFADLGPHVAGVLERAAHEADQLRAEAQAYAERVRADADRAAEDLRALAGSEAATAAAQREALLLEARNRADELLQRSQRHADRRAAEVVAAAEQEAGALRSDLARLRDEHQRAVTEARAAAERLLAASEPTVVDLRESSEVRS
jgi:cell division septum initiation protein DivIVA